MDGRKLRRRAARAFIGVPFSDTVPAARARPDKRRELQRRQPPGSARSWFALPFPAATFRGCGRAPQRPGTRPYGEVNSRRENDHENRHARPPRLCPRRCRRACSRPVSRSRRKGRSARHRQRDLCARDQGRRRQVTDGLQHEEKQEKPCRSRWSRCGRRQKTRIAREGDVLIDADPVSNSQDPHLKFFTVKQERREANRATVAAIFTDKTGDRPEPERTVRYDFVREGGRWIIKTTSAARRTERSGQPGTGWNTR